MIDVCKVRTSSGSMVVGSKPASAINQNDEILSQDKFFEICKDKTLKSIYGSAKSQIRNLDLTGISIKKNNKIFSSILHDLGVDLV